MVLWAHPCPYPVRHLYRFSCFCAAYGRVAVLYSGLPSALTIVPLHWGILTPHLTYGSLIHPSLHSEWYYNWFSLFCRAHGCCDRRTECFRYMAHCLRSCPGQSKFSFEECGTGYGWLTSVAEMAFAAGVDSWGEICHKIHIQGSCTL